MYTSSILQYALRTLTLGDHRKEVSKHKVPLVACFRKADEAFVGVLMTVINQL